MNYRIIGMDTDNKEGVGGRGKTLPVCLCVEGEVILIIPRNSATRAYKLVSKEGEESGAVFDLIMRMIREWKWTHGRPFLTTSPFVNCALFLRNYKSKSILQYLSPKDYNTHEPLTAYTVSLPIKKVPVPLSYAKMLHALLLTISSPT
jgi:hypothetical protein